MGGKTCEVTDQTEGALETSLAGWLPDQTALCGVLNALYNLNLPLLSVGLSGLEEARDGKEAG